MRPASLATTSWARAACRSSIPRSSGPSAGCSISLSTRSRPRWRISASGTATWRRPGAPTRRSLYSMCPRISRRSKRRPSHPVTGTGTASWIVPAPRHPRSRRDYGRPSSRAGNSLSRRATTSVRPAITCRAFWQRLPANSRTRRSRYCCARRRSRRSADEPVPRPAWRAVIASTSTALSTCGKWSAMPATMGR